MSDHDNYLHSAARKIDRAYVASGRGDNYGMPAAVASIGAGLVAIAEAIHRAIDTYEQRWDADDVIWPVPGDREQAKRKPPTWERRPGPPWDGDQQ